MIRKRLPQILVAFITSMLFASPVMADGVFDESTYRMELARPLPDEGDYSGWLKRSEAAEMLGDMKAALAIQEAAVSAMRYRWDAHRAFLVKLYDTKMAAGVLTRADVEAFPLDFSDPIDLIKHAQGYAWLKDWDMARKFMQQAESAAVGNKKYSLPSQIAHTKAMIALETGSINDAVFLNKLAVKEADSYADMGREEVHRTAQNGTRVKMRLTYAVALQRAGRYQDAAATIAEALRLSEKLTVLPGVRAAVLQARGQLEQAANPPQVAMQSFKIAEEALQQEAPTHENREALASVQINRIEQYLMLNQHNEARDMLARYRQANASLPDDNQAVLAFALIDWHSDAAAQALAMLSTELERVRQRFGAKHYFALRTEALRSAVESTQQATAGTPILRAAIDKLLAAKAPADAGPLDRIFTRDIFSTFLQAAAKTPSGNLNLSYQLAEELQHSTVSKVLIEAARKSVTTQPELARFVGRQRELQQSLASTYASLSDINSRDKALRDPASMLALQNTLKADNDELLQIERNISSHFPEFNQLTSGNAMQLGDVGRMLARDEVLVSLLPTDAATFVWVLTRDRAPLFYAAPVSEIALREQVARLRKTLDVGDQLADRIPAFDVATAQQIYTTLLGPAQELLTGRNQLIVNASGVLGQIPFGVLVTGPANADGIPWLARIHAITHVSSIGAFASLRQSSFRAAAIKPFIGFGDPQFARTVVAAAPGATRNLALPRSAVTDADQLAAALKRYDQIPPLPETRDEILAMATALGADKNTDVFLGKAASREAVLKAPLVDYQVVSFSTHGLMVGDLPGLTQPALALAAPEKEGDNPLLLLEDVMSLKLNADWVVLSACNTAAADGEASEALSGLARGFFYAGARSLLVTHWAVESTSAQLLMTETFKRYAANKSLSRAEALRQAQLTLMGNPKYAHPFFWAPYALVGDGN
jgi:CHAT domain-containing protein